MIRKIMKSKVFVFSCLIIDLLVFVFCMLNINSKIEFCILYILLHFIFIVLFFHFILKLPIINFNRMFLNLKINRFRSACDSDEIYLKTLNIETFDGSGSLTHPSLLFFENGLHGYKYWMAYTPYDNNNISLENPCIVVSNDGINFKKFKNLENPLLEIIPVKKPYTFYNDPFLIYTDRLELWYRLTIEDDILINDVYRIYSYDGENWSEPEKMIENDGSCYMSLSIVKKEDIYYLYYFNMNFEFKFRTSSDLKIWSEEREVKLTSFSGEYWHGEVSINKNNFELLFIDRQHNLYIATSIDGKEFIKLDKIEISYLPKDYLYKNAYLYKSNIMHIGDKVYLYIPFRYTTLNWFSFKRIFHHKWRLTLSVLNNESFDKMKRGV